jgi:hypothetical protein
VLACTGGVGGGFVLSEGACGAHEELHRECLRTLRIPPDPEIRPRVQPIESSIKQAIEGSSTAAAGRQLERGH